MVKTTYKSSLPWSAICSVIVYFCRPVRIWNLCQCCYTLVKLVWFSVPWKGIQTKRTRKNWAHEKGKEKNALEYCGSPLSLSDLGRLGLVLEPLIYTPRMSKKLSVRAVIWVCLKNEQQTTAAMVIAVQSYVVYSRFTPASYFHQSSYCGY